MRARDKILILMLIVTLTLGAFILYSSDSDNSLSRFRSLVSSSPLRLVTDEILSSADSASVWYGGISLLAIFMVGLVLKSASGAELRAFRERLVGMEVAKAELETLLQDTVWKEKHARQAKDTAVKELEASINRTYALERQLRENEKLLKSTEQDSKALRSQVISLSERPGDMASSHASRQSESMLRNELRKTIDLLQAKESAAKQLEKNLTGKAYALETQLSVKETLLKERDTELKALKAQLSEKRTNHQAEHLLAEELRQAQQAAQAKDAASKELEKSLTGKLHAVEIQLNEKQELLQGRDTELEALRSEMAGLTERLSDVASAKERAENALQQELKKKTELLGAKESAIKSLETNLSARVHALENQLSEKDAFLKDRDAELGALNSQLSAMGLAKETIEAQLREELRKTTEILAVKDSTVRDLEKSLNKTVAALENHVGEQETILKNRDTEIEALKSEVETFKAQLKKMELVSDRAEGMGQEQIAQGNGSSIELEESSKRVHSLQSLLREKEDLLETREGKIQRLESELKEKRTELARREIAVWQSIERRILWKQRLRKIGINFKD
ncbi:MAG: hypothetical protein GEU77_05915 [Deltaproteobacteria bacterium]|nr:hypothetical protein [Deltaproteobacteria bacterium]